MTDELDSAFVERVAHALRAPERADPTFRARVMSHVHTAEHPHENRDHLRHTPSGDASIRLHPPGSRWLRPFYVRLTPLTSLALAAGFSGIVLASALLVSRQTRPEATVVAAAADTVHVVRFVFVDSTARSVALVGAFNQWQKNTTVLRPTERPGVWTATVPLPAGRHEYAFIVSDGEAERWVADPLSASVSDEFGTESSILSVGTNRTL